jgi:hypothetical protein
MRYRPLVVVLLVTATGCFGGSASSSVTNVDIGQMAEPPPQLVVTYWVGRPERSRTQVTAQCPARGRCTVQRIPGDRPAEFAMHVRRGLSCAPARGDYAHPDRVCRALIQYMSLAHGGSRCFCASSLLPGGVVEGVLRGRRIRVFVDFCDACGHGRAAAGDVAIVTPNVGA